LLEGLARVGGGLMYLVDSDVLECAAVLHGALLVGCRWLRLWSAHAALYPLRKRRNLGLGVLVSLALEGLGEALLS